MRLPTLFILFASIGCSSSADAPPVADASTDTATATDVATESGDGRVCQATGEICDPTDPTNISPAKCCSGECGGVTGGTPRCK